MVPSSLLAWTVFLTMMVGPLLCAVAMRRAGPRVNDLPRAAE